MRKLGLIALFALILWSSLLYGELEVLISEQVEINPPYPFDQYFYNGNDEVHFYRTVNEEGFKNTYHFSLQEIDYGDYQYTEETLVASVDTLGTGIGEWVSCVQLNRVFNCDTIHLIYSHSSYSRDIRRVSMLENYSQLTSSIDVTGLSPFVTSVTSTCDSLVVIDRFLWEESPSHGTMEYYKCNLISGTYELLATSTGNPYHSTTIGDYVGIIGIEESGGTDSFALYDNELNFLGYESFGTHNYQISNLFGHPDTPTVPFGDGFITYSLNWTGVGDNCFLFYTCRVNDQFETTYITGSSSGKINITETGEVYASSYPYDGSPSFKYLTYNGEGWTHIWELLPHYITGPVMIDGFCVTYRGYEDFLGFIVYEHGEIVSQQQVDLPTQIGSLAENFFDQLFYLDRWENTVCYFIYDYTYPNSEVVNPVVNTITTSNYPNPFNPETTIEYSVPAKGNVEITVYNILGQKVNTLVNTKQPKGTYNVVWNGTDSNNNSLSSGVYFYKVEQNGKSTTNKIVLMK